MSRPLLSSTAARRFSQAPQTRLFSTSRPAQRLSAFPDGKLTACRQHIHIQQSVPRCLSRPSAPRCSFLHPQHVYFSSSTVRPATKVTQNPRAGDDGATLMIKISPRAVEVRLTPALVLHMFLGRMSEWEIPGWWCWFPLELEHSHTSSLV